MVFYLRAREGRDVMLPYIIDIGILFQSTHPRGVRLGLEGVGEFEIEFQSTRPRGARHGTRRLSCS